MVLSTVKAEHIAFMRVVTQAIWLTKFLYEVGLSVQIPIPIYTDNQVLIANIINGKNYLL